MQNTIVKIKFNQRGKRANWQSKCERGYYRNACRHLMSHTHINKIKSHRQCFRFGITYFAVLNRQNDEMAFRINRNQQHLGIAFPYLTIHEWMKRNSLKKIKRNNRWEHKWFIWVIRTFSNREHLAFPMVKYWWVEFRASRPFFRVRRSFNSNALNVGRLIEIFCVHSWRVSFSL